jgi:hypothetical protein
MRTLRNTGKILFAILAGLFLTFLFTEGLFEREKFPALTQEPDVDLSFQPEDITAITPLLLRVPSSAPAQVPQASEPRKAPEVASPLSAVTTAPPAIVATSTALAGPSLTPPAPSGGGGASAAPSPALEQKPEQKKEEVFDVPVAVGAPLHMWDPLLGGVTWISSRAAAKEQAKALAWYDGPVLLDIKSQANGFGYRFDLNTFASGTMEHGYFTFDGTDAGEPATLDDIFQIFGAAPNARFILHVPVPHDSLPLGSARFEWQTPAFYGAQLQYLFGTADSNFMEQVPTTTLDFFSVHSAFNWANLRARRGRVAPYRAEAIILGQEPYHIEGWSAGDGAGFGARANEYRAAMRARGITLPYGVHVSQLNPTDRDWFRPMINQLPASDSAGYLDLYHYYSFVTNDDWLRSFPVAERAEGFTNWWKPRESWRADYARFLWIIEDTRQAVRDLGVSPELVKMGFGEHGIAISSPFKWNDMMGALHWANWLAELMRYDIDWDSTWVLFGEGFSTAQVQLRNGVLTKPPAFFVHDLARKFRGRRYLETNASSPYGVTKDPEGKEARFPWVVVRAFSAQGNSASRGESSNGETRELFVVNQHAVSPAFLRGFEGWRVKEWEVLRGDTYASENPLGTPEEPPVRTLGVTPPPDGALRISPISVNRIVLVR